MAHPDYTAILGDLQDLVDEALEGADRRTRSCLLGVRDWIYHMRLGDHSEVSEWEAAECIQDLLEKAAPGLEPGILRRLRALARQL